MVIKVGTSILTGVDGLLNKKYISDLVANLIELQKDKHEILIVSSGAIGAGRARLHINVRPKTLREKQAFAAVGQPLVMNAYSNAFAKYGKSVAQILITRDDFDGRAKYINIRNTLNALIGNNVTPIINENDSVAIEEINFGDNDTLAALVAAAMDAEKLVIFTDVDGFYDGHSSNSSVIPRIEKITEEIENLATSSSSSGKGTGGMKTKIIAAKIAVASGVDTIITNGLKLNLLKEIISGCQVGTIIKAKKRCLGAKKMWIAFSKKPKGTIFIDAKASEIVISKGKSLLAVGITKVNGIFKRGDTVNISDAETKKDFARGLTNYDSEDVEKIKGKKTSEMKKIIDVTDDVVIHRDNLVLLWQKN
ncbi:MAG: glutamate 5-kinase [Endomicrobium sp.]|jgi:glutamate 5-kinase|nr:glutamate 5-kinase [Endomicrobium sp.]